MEEERITITPHLSFDRQAIDSVLNGEGYRAEDLLALFSRGLSLVVGADTRSVYNESIGVGSLTLSAHSLAVLQRFETYFAHRSLPNGVDMNFFRVLLVLHDSGRTLGSTTYE